MSKDELKTLLKEATELGINAGDKTFVVLKEGAEGLRRLVEKTRSERRLH